MENLINESTLPASSPAGGMAGRKSTHQRINASTNQRINDLA